ncbi:uncharacterized protein RHO17_020968 isoform 3-T3 [Thomomys bottae]
MRASANGVRRHAPLTTVSQWCPETRPLAGNIRVPAPGWRGQPSQSVYVLKHIRLLHHKKDASLRLQILATQQQKMSRMNQMSSHPGNDVRKRLLFIRGETDTLGFEKSPETTPPRIKSIITNKTKDCHKFPGTLGKKHNIHGVFLCLINHSHKK